jgi:hypothetical protein
VYRRHIEAMPRPTKKQINIKMPETLIKALKTRAEDEGNTLTDLVIQLCEQGLGIEKNHPQATAPSVEPAQLDERIAEYLAPLQRRLEALEAELGESVA